MVLQSANLAGARSERGVLAEARGGRSSLIVATLALWSALGLVFAGCETDERPRSLVDQFKVLAVKCEPPDVFLTGSGSDRKVQVSALIVDPDDAGVPLEFAIIACTNYEGAVGCLEEAELVDEEDIARQELELDEEDYREFFSRFVVRGRIEAPGRSAIVTGEIEVPANFLYVMDLLEAAEEEGSQIAELDTTMYVLACREGACPILEDLDLFLSGDPAAPSGEELMYRISVREALMSGTTRETAALAVKEYRVIETSRADANLNPSIGDWATSGCSGLLESPEASSASCEVKMQLASSSLQLYEVSPDVSLSTQESASARFFSTAGEMTPSSTSIYATTPDWQSATIVLSEGQARPEWVDLYLVVVDSRGGLDFLAIPYGIE